MAQRMSKSQLGGFVRPYGGFAGGTDRLAAWKEGEKKRREAEERELQHSVLKSASGSAEVLRQARSTLKRLLRRFKRDGRNDAAGAAAREALARANGKLRGAT
jgi:hypothetical protein